MRLESRRKHVCITKAVKGVRRGWTAHLQIVSF
jgi:hypothetical protein